MFARVTLLEIDATRTDVESALSLFRETVLPELRDHGGYEGAYVLATPEGKGLIMSFWATEHDAEEAELFAGEQLDRHMALFRSPPGREHYEVVLADTPAAALG
jgi:hypothetical protein